MGAGKQSTIASVLGFDMVKKKPLLDAPFIHQSNEQLVALLNPVTDGRAVIVSWANPSDSGSGHG